MTTSVHTNVKPNPCINILSFSTFICLFHVAKAIIFIMTFEHKKKTIERKINKQTHINFHNYTIKNMHTQRSHKHKNMHVNTKAHRDGRKKINNLCSSMVQFFLFILYSPFANPLFTFGIPLVLKVSTSLFNLGSMLFHIINDDQTFCSFFCSHMVFNNSSSSLLLNNKSLN